MVQDSTVVYHTYSEPLRGHPDFENHVDRYIQVIQALTGIADWRPSNTAETSLEVSTPKAFVQNVASETRQLAKIYGFLYPDNNGHWFCCVYIPEEQLPPKIQWSLNRAIIYSAKLLSFYFRQHGATELYDAVSTAVVF
jgi:hypothetical protein